jgi:Multiubiquitin
MAEHEQQDHHEYEIIVNGRAYKAKSDVVTFDEVVKLAPNLPPPGPDVEYKVVFKHAAHPHEGTLIQGEDVKIKNGTEFVVSATNRS